MTPLNSKHDPFLLKRGMRRVIEDKKTSQSYCAGWIAEFINMTRIHLSDAAMTAILSLSLC